MNIATIYPGATLHATWSGALASVENQGKAAATFEVISSPPNVLGSSPRPHIAGMAVPLTATDLLALARVEPHLQWAVPEQLSPDLLAALPDVAESLGDLIKLQHPDWQSGLDPVVSGFAIIVSSVEFYDALKGNRSGLKVLAGAQLGAALLNVVAKTGIIPGSEAVQGVCFIVKTASSLTKIVLDAKGVPQK